jgi:hypothetical protein
MHNEEIGRKDHFATGSNYFTFVTAPYTAPGH